MIGGRCAVSVCGTPRCPPAPQGRPELNPALHSCRLFLFSWTVREQFLYATFVETGDVRPCTVESPLEFVSFMQELVPVRDEELVLLAETIPIVFDPGAIRLSQLSQQVADELGWVAISRRRLRISSSALSARSLHEASS